MSSIFGAEPCFAHGSLHEQIDHISHEIEHDPDNAELYFRRGELYRLHRAWRKAAADLDRAARLAPDWTEVEYARAVLWVEAGRAEKAVATLDAFLSKRPDDPRALLARGRARAKLGDAAAAVQDFDRALALHPHPQPDDYLERARLLSTLGPERLLEAIRGLDAARARLGQVLPLELLACDLELRAEKTNDALARLERLSGVMPEPERLTKKGVVLDTAGQVREARIAREAALAAIQSLPAEVQARPAYVALRAKLAKALTVQGR